MLSLTAMRLRLSLLDSDWFLFCVNFCIRFPCSFIHACLHAYPSPVLQLNKNLRNCKIKNLEISEYFQYTYDTMSYGFGLFESCYDHYWNLLRFVVCFWLPFLLCLVHDTYDILCRWIWLHWNRWGKATSKSWEYPW